MAIHGLEVNVAYTHTHIHRYVRNSSFHRLFALFYSSSPRKTRFRSQFFFVARIVIFWNRLPCYFPFLWLFLLPSSVATPFHFPQIPLRIVNSNERFTKTYRWRFSIDIDRTLVFLLLECQILNIASVNEECYVSVERSIRNDVSLTSCWKISFESRHFQKIISLVYNFFDFFVNFSKFLNFTRCIIDIESNVPIPLLTFFI